MHMQVIWHQRTDTLDDNLGYLAKKLKILRVQLICNVVNSYLNCTSIKLVFLQTGWEQTIICQIYCIYWKWVVYLTQTLWRLESFASSFHMLFTPVIRGKPNPIFIKPQVSVPLISRLVADYREGGTTPQEEPGFVIISFNNIIQQ